MRRDYAAAGRRLFYSCGIITLASMFLVGLVPGAQVVGVTALGVALFGLLMIVFGWATDHHSRP